MRELPFAAIVSMLYDRLRHPNVPRIDQALTRRTGFCGAAANFSVLNFRYVNVPVLDRLYEAYSFRCILLSGRLVTGDRSPNRYLVESIARFPGRRSFRDKVARARGFEAGLVHARLSGGIVAIIRAGNFRHESQIRVGLSPAPLSATQSRRDPERMDKLLKAHI